MDSVVTKPEERDRESAIVPPTEDRVGGPDPFEGAIAEAEKRLLMGAAEHRAKAEEYNRKADDLERRARQLRQPNSSNPAPTHARIGNWVNTDRATAMHEFMRQFPIGYRVQISAVAQALVEGGCDISGKLRPGATNPQKEAERNLFITAGQNKDKYKYDTGTREVWRRE